MSAAYLFLTERLRAFAGYWSTPVTYDPLDFYLPEFAVTSHRVVLLKDRLWELWSPNAKEHAYYPGIQAPGTKHGTELPPFQRRSDGHLGRFDYTVSPQHFDPARPWLGFIRKWTKDGRPENASFADVWTPSPMPTRGTFKSSFVKAVRSRILRLIRAMEGHQGIAVARNDLWTDRPRHLTSGTSDEMCLEMTVDNGTDLLTRIQHDMKELSAWNRMTDSILRDLSQYTSAAKVPLADETLIGVWLNGCDEENGLWLIRNKVPCYIVHEWDKFEDRRQFERTTLNCVSMLTATFLSRYEEEMKTREKPLIAAGQILLHQDSDYVSNEFEWNKANETKRRAMSTPQSQGHTSSGYINPRPMSPISSQTLGIEEGATRKRIIPPPVAGSSHNITWTNWVQDEREDGVIYFRKRALNYDGLQGKHVYYDRRRGRILRLNEILCAPPGYRADRKVFGLPAPNWPYSETQDERVFFEHPISEWCYKDKEPANGDEGRIHIKDMEHSEDEVSLGSDSDDGHWLISPEEAMSGSVRFPRPGPMNVDLQPNVPVQDRPVASASTALSMSIVASTAPDKDRQNEKTSRHRSSSRILASDRHYSPRYSEIASGQPRFRRSRSRSPRRPSQYRNSDRDYRTQYRRSHSQSYRSWSRSPPRYQSSFSRDSLTRRRSPSRSPPRRVRSRSPCRTCSRSPRRRDDRPSTQSARSTLQSSSAGASDATVANYQQSKSMSNSPALLDRMSNPISSSTQPFIDEDDEKTQIIRPSSVIPGHVMTMFPVPQAPPVAILPSIVADGQSRFVILWNVPLVYCWDNILEWLDEIIVFCHKAEILQVY